MGSRREATTGPLPPLSESPRISVAVATRDRPDALEQCIRSVLRQTYPNIGLVVLDDSPERYPADALIQREFPAVELCYLRSERQLGVAGARNRLLQAASGDIIVVLDDDATLPDPGALERVVSHLRSWPDVGLLAFRIVNLLGNQTSMSLPFPRRAVNRDVALGSQPVRVSYFVGTAHALRREVCDVCGFYQSDLFYGGEELDLSYRVVQAGIAVLYTPDITVQHAPGTSALATDNVVGLRREAQYSMRNAVWIAYKYLPLPYLPVYVGLAAAREFMGCFYHRGFGPVLRGAWHGVSQMGSQARTPLDRRALEYLRENFGRLWY